MASRVSSRFLSASAGLFLLIIGLGLASFGTSKLTNMYAWEIFTLKNSSETESRWVKPSEPAIVKFYIFNVTNPEDVSKGAKPKLMEIGPYVYGRFSEKFDFETTNTYELSYKINSTFRFSEKDSGKMMESDKVIILNGPLAEIILAADEEYSDSTKKLNKIWPSLFPGQQNIFLKTTVKELLFDGIEINCESNQSDVLLLCQELETRKSLLLRKHKKNFKFSFFFHENRTYPETFKINNGVTDLKKSAELLGINNSETLEIWNGPYCNRLIGTDGSQFSVHLSERKHSLFIYDYQVCRSLFIEFEKTVKKSDIQLYRYTFSERLFQSAEREPMNECFCRLPFSIAQRTEIVSTNTSLVCLGNGLLTLLPCIGSPLVLSFPHFYLADDSHAHYSGLKPSKKYHESYFEIEPVYGITVSSCRRFQYNMEIRKIDGIDIAAHLSDEIFPILWFEEKTVLSTDLFKSLLRYGLYQKLILECGTIAFIVVGILLMIVPCGLWLSKKKNIRLKKKKQLQSVDRKPRRAWPAPTANRRGMNRDELWFKKSFGDTVFSVREEIRRDSRRTFAPDNFRRVL